VSLAYSDMDRTTTMARRRRQWGRSIVVEIVAAHPSTKESSPSIPLRQSRSRVKQFSSRMRGVRSGDPK